MKTTAEVQEILRQCKYQDWEFRLEERNNGDLLLQVRFYAVNTDDEGGTHLVEMSGRKWFISRHATRTEIVQTAWLAVLKAVEHEARDAFSYRERAIFNTHIAVERLIDVASKVDVRKTPLEGAA